MILRKLARCYRRLVFALGDIRWRGWRYFPPVTFRELPPRIKGDEIAKALELARPCDVVVLRHEGMLPNRVLGGAMVHAALCVGRDRVVEAVSDDEGGVVERHLIDTLQADYACILRPQAVGFSFHDIADVIERARSIVGFKYDVFFDFNTEEEYKLIQKDYAKAKRGKVRFACTEVPLYCFNDYRTTLDLYRVPNNKFLARLLRAIGLPIGEHLLTADMYFVAHFELVWASSACTPEWFSRMGCGEKVLAAVSNYWYKADCHRRGMADATSHGEDKQSG